MICRRLYNEALRIVNSVALQYLTCNDNVGGGGDASNLLKAMQDQERLSFVRQDSFLSQCSKDPWFLEHFKDSLSPMKRNVSTTSASAEAAAATSGSLNSKKELLLRLPHKLRPEKPLIDSKVKHSSYPAPPLAHKVPKKSP